MEIKTKFNIGDKVYTTKMFYIERKKKCQFCNDGTFKVIANNNKELKLNCTECYGNGYLTSRLEAEDGNVYKTAWCPTSTEYTIMSISLVAKTTKFNNNIHYSIEYGLLPSDAIINGGTKRRSSDEYQLRTFVKEFQVSYNKSELLHIARNLNKNKVPGMVD